MADWEAARPYLEHWTAERIEAFLAQRPDVVFRIVHDIYDVVKAEQERDRGEVRIGRRPRRSAASMDEVWDTLFPEPYSMDPFPEAMQKLLNGRSQRQFARQVPCHQTTLSRLMAGALEPDLTMLERIAEAAKVHPAFFKEWRAQYLGGLITRVFMERPNMSVTALERVGKS